MASAIERAGRAVAASLNQGERVLVRVVAIGLTGYELRMRDGFLKARGGEGVRIGWRWFVCGLIGLLPLMAGAYNTNVFNVPDDLKRVPTFSEAYYLRDQYNPFCPLEKFDTEQEHYAYFISCAPHLDTLGTVTTYYENYAFTSSTPYSRDALRVTQSVKSVDYTFNIRSVYSDGRPTSTSTIAASLTIRRQLYCSDGYGFKEPGEYESPGVVFDTLQCNPLPTPVETASCPATGNPILTGQARKRQLETDLPLTTSGLEFTRQYDSSQNQEWSRVAMGSNWRHRYQRSLRISSLNNSISVRHYGLYPHPELFFFENGIWKKDADLEDQLIQQKDPSGNTTGWQYTLASDGSTESYDPNGKLLAITARNGQRQTLRYSDASTPTSIAPAPGWLIGVVAATGQQLQFSYDNQFRLATLTDPNGNLTRYAYDEGSPTCTGSGSTLVTGTSCNNLTSVTYPDNTKRQYRYNESAYTANTDLPHALTGLIDENNQRYATWRYDSSGRAIGSEHANGAYAYTLNYTTGTVTSGAYGFPTITSTTVTDPLGSARTHSFATILGVAKPSGQSQPGGAGCGPAASSIGYDANGNLNSQTDFNGNRTTYSFDQTRNLEISRVEAAGTPSARTISTQWHATYRLPIKLAEPNRITTNTYDPNGNLLSKTEQATIDNTGAAGFTVTPTGPARTTTYSYNSSGKLLTVTGPRTDVIDRTTYTYDTQGNLATITNPLGQITTINQTDATGKPLKITDANGVVTTLTYSPRGWLTSQTNNSGSTSETTRYQYDAVGQLIKVTLPDASAISYVYDAAHRLIKIADSFGNHIDYTLDELGNRIGEQVKDADGNLARQSTQIVDALGRVMQVSGSAR